MTWAYILTKAMYFPGTFLKGFWEHLACRILHIPVFAADKYVSRNILSGHVSMTPAETPGKALWVCLLPSLMNLLFGAPAFAAGIVTLGYLGVDVIDPLSGKFCPLFIVYCLVYLFGASCMCNLAPYLEDIHHARQMIYGKNSTVGTPVKVLAAVPVGLLTALAYAERYCVTWLATVGLLMYWILT